MRKARAVRDFVVGAWTVFPDRNTIQAAGDVVHLEPRVMDLLVYLAERPNEVLSLDQIVADVWPHAFVTIGAPLPEQAAAIRGSGRYQKKTR